MFGTRFSRLAVASLMMLGAASAAKASPVVFGNFEGSSTDGFGQWSNGVVALSSNANNLTFTHTSYGATNGSSALEMTGPNQYVQSLAYDFGANNDISTFMANDVLSFDVSARSAAYLSASGGIEKIENVILNGPGWGFTALPSSSYTFGYYAGYNGATYSFSLNYDAVKAAMGPNPGYLQMIITASSGYGVPNMDLVFDNFALSSIPEPASFSMLGLGALGLMTRRRSR